MLICWWPLFRAVRVGQIMKAPRQPQPQQCVSLLWFPAAHFYGVPRGFSRGFLLNFSHLAIEAERQEIRVSRAAYRMRLQALPPLYAQ